MPGVSTVTSIYETHKLCQINVFTNVLKSDGFRLSTEGACTPDFVAYKGSINQSIDQSINA